MLFSFFNPINYTSKTVGSKKQIPTADIFRNYQEYFKRVAKNYLLQNYYIQGSPRPEELSYQIYGNTQFYWILLMCNEIYDPFYDWIKSQDSCYQAAEQKYSDLGGNQTLYYTDSEGKRYYNVEQVPADSGIWYSIGETDYTKDYHIQYRGALAAVDIFEDAILENEKLRQIKIINPNDINSFISDIVREMEKAPE